jgi:hypothetical protein
MVLAATTGGLAGALVVSRVLAPARDHGGR